MAKTKNYDKLMKLVVVKRNGRKVNFDGKKIAIAIKKAFDSVNNPKYSDKDPNDVYLKVNNYIYDNFLSNVSDSSKIKIEEIQDIIVNILSKKYPDVYNSFQTYREKQTKLRRVFEEKRNHKLYSLFDQLTKVNDGKLLNNDFAQTPLEKTEYFGESILKQVATHSNIKKKFIESVEEGDIHVHNIESIPVGATGFTQIDYLKILENGIVLNGKEKSYVNNIEEALKQIVKIMHSLSREQFYGESIPAFDYFLAPVVLKTFKEDFWKILTSYFELLEFKQFLPMFGIQAIFDKIDSVIFDISIFDKHFRESDILKSAIKKAYYKAKENLEKRVENGLLNFVYDLETLAYEEKNKVYTLNLGTDESYEGRLVTKKLLKVLEKKNTNAFEIVFKVKYDKNLKANSKNHDLLLDAIKLEQTNTNIKYSLIDAKFNKKLDNGEYIKEVAYLNGHRIIDNNLDDKRTIVLGRGLLATVSINLASIAIREMCANNTFKKKNVYERLDELLNNAKQVLYDIFEIQTSQKKKDFPISFGQNIWLDSEKIKDEDKLRRALKHGILAISFVGLYDMIEIFGMMDRKSNMEKTKRFAIDIVKYMKKKCDEFSEEYTLNFQLLSKEENENARLFIDIDKAIFGTIKSLDKIDKYTNSYKLKEDIRKKLSVDEQLEWESLFTSYINAGQTTKIFVKDKDLNQDFVLSLLEKSRKNNIGLLEILKLS